MRVALGQMASGPEKAANLEVIAVRIGEAARAGAGLVVFPECSMVHFADPSRPLTGEAEPLDGPFGSRLSELAARHRIAVACGVYEPADGERVFNTVAVFGPDGGLLGAYRKIHLYDAFAIQESKTVRPGDGRTLTFDLDGVRFGVMTCYDLRFPELARMLVDEGAQAIVLPADWVRGLLKESHWEVLVRARAIENTVYVLACGLIGPRSCGSSMVVDPMGVAVARAGEVEQLLLGEVSGERVEGVRRVNPSLVNRRIDIGRVREYPLSGADFDVRNAYTGRRG
jgi:deaminated glutathione amidase